MTRVIIARRFRSGAEMMLFFRFLLSARRRAN